MIVATAFTTHSSWFRRFNFFFFSFTFEPAVELRPGTLAVVERSGRENPHLIFHDREGPGDFRGGN